MAEKITLNERHDKLYNEVKKLAKRANQRMVRTEREFGKDTWASKRLESKLNSYVNAWTESGRVKVNKSMSMTKLHAIEKALKQFDKSKTSTISGIKQTIKNQKAGMKKSLSMNTEYNGNPDEDVEELSDEEIETIYTFFEDNYARDILQYIPSSDMIQLLIDSRQHNDTKSQFLERIGQYIEIGNDTTMKRKLSHIYNKFVK